MILEAASLCYIILSCLSLNEVIYLSLADNI